ncbi:MAG: hypothetical protein KDH94_07425, partial [Coxiellaceae bacterium]|nr:hypothetical protein [Coxiellaceae bacterium]
MLYKVENAESLQQFLQHYINNELRYIELASRVEARQHGLFSSKIVAHKQVLDFVRQLHAMVKFGGTAQGWRSIVTALETYSLSMKDGSVIPLRQYIPAPISANAVDQISDRVLGEDFARCYMACRNAYHAAELAEKELELSQQSHQVIAQPAGKGQAIHSKEIDELVEYTRTDCQQPTNKMQGLNDLDR